MANEYTQKEILNEFISKRPYQLNCVNYNGGTDCSIDGKTVRVPYIEIIAEYIINTKKFSVNEYLCDRENFKFDQRESATEGTEKGLCREWYEKRKFSDDPNENERIGNELGIPFECELNIVKGTKVNVDLVSYLEAGEDSTLYLIEVKGKKKNGVYCSDETLLRCALEIETYWESLHPKFDQMIHDLSEERKIDLSKINANRVKKAILVPSDSRAAKQFLNEKYKNVHALLKKWDIKVVIFDKNIKLPQ